MMKTLSILGIPRNMELGVGKKVADSPGEAAYEGCRADGGARCSRGRAFPWVGEGRGRARGWPFGPAGGGAGSAIALLRLIGYSG